MKKIVYRLGYYILKIRAFLTGKSVVYMGKDFFRVGYGLYEIVGLKSKKLLESSGTIEHMFDHYFIIDEDTIVDLSDGYVICFEGVKIINNTIGWIIDNKQYDINLEQLLEHDVVGVVFNHIVTERPGKRKTTIYEVYTFEGEKVHEFPPTKGRLSTEEDGDYFVLKAGKKEKRLHKMGISNQIGELK